MQHTVHLLMGLFINFISFAVFNLIFVTCYNLLRISLLTVSFLFSLVDLPLGALSEICLPKITEIANIEYDASREISQPLSDIGLAALERRQRELCT